MPTRRLPLIALLILLLLIVIALFFVLRNRGEAAVGPAIALCPGPDLYGYRCDSGNGYSYIDATHDTFLYADDGIISLDLPFAFTFYGTPYTAINASVNGNLQFTTTNPDYANLCLNEVPAGAMGDMVAPYWDDLDLRFYGYLETEVIGEAPNRIFVVEWDSVPRFDGLEDDVLTFEVQFFEGSNDIVFLYQDVTTVELPNGSGATVGLQSAAQGLALQYSCEQASLSEGSGLLFVHPLEPNSEIGQEMAVALSLPQPPYQLESKGIVADLQAEYQLSGRPGLNQLAQQWLSEAQQRYFSWQWLDVDGSGRDSLVALWRGPSQHPERSQLTVLTPDENGQLVVVFDQFLANRQADPGRVEFYKVSDLNGDGFFDLILRDRDSGRLFALFGGQLRYQALDDTTK